MPQNVSNILSAYLTAIELIVALLRRAAIENRINSDDMNETDEDQKDYEFVEVV